MRLRMKTRYAGPGKVGAAGDVIDLPDDEAFPLVEHCKAEPSSAFVPEPVMRVLRPSRETSR